ncbi:XRE family transcriptional regulator [Apilactobacillus timberlakei]|uniref:helix-turn-helix domain-containing protein n=1 Tax=Apilactobacillus timberlakei TaxID=2008380 RepID=UPI001128394C|nr:helix-turn-helix transcriptional regulator [Apilactobacillus timberlakei]TPR15013.1 XRE family transcriptional regulator [Apilactobacillus timberlakei]
MNKEISTSKQVNEKLDDLIRNEIKYSQYYIAKFGIRQSSISELRNGKRKLENFKWSTIQKMLNAYDYKQIEDRLNDEENKDQSVPDEFYNMQDLASIFLIKGTEPFIKSIKHNADYLFNELIKNPCMYDYLCSTYISSICLLISYCDIHNDYNLFNIMSLKNIIKELSHVDRDLSHVNSENNITKKIILLLKKTGDNNDDPLLLLANKVYKENIIWTAYGFRRLMLPVILSKDELQ